MVHVSPNRMSVYEFKNKTYKVDIPTGHILSQLLEPSYWAHVAHKLQTGDEIIAVSEDNLYRAHFYVLDKGVAWASVYCLKFDELTKAFDMPAEADTNYVIEFSGNFHKWRIRRRSPEAVMVSQLPTRDKAVEWLKNYQQTLLRDKINKTPAEDAA